jgi:hypothetical protein
MGDTFELGESTDAEVRDLIARTLIRESAQAAGLEVALPYGEGLGGRLLVTGTWPGERGSPVRGRYVHVAYRGYADGHDSPSPPLRPGELVAVHDVADAQPEAVFLLMAEDLSRMSASAVALREEWRATPGQWRARLAG